MPVLLYFVIQEHFPISNAYCTSIVPFSLLSLFFDRSVLNGVVGPGGVGLVGFAILSNQNVNVPEILKDERYDRRVDLSTGDSFGSSLTVPIISPRDEVMGAVQLIRKRDQPMSRSFDRLCFTKEEEVRRRAR